MSDLLEQISFPLVEALLVGAELLQQGVGPLQLALIVLPDILRVSQLLFPLLDEIDLQRRSRRR